VSPSRSSFVLPTRGDRSTRLGRAVPECGSLVAPLGQAPTVQVTADSGSVTTGGGPGVHHGGHNAPGVPGVPRPVPRPVSARHVHPVRTSRPEPDPVRLWAGRRPRSCASPVNPA